MPPTRYFSSTKWSSRLAAFEYRYSVAGEQESYHICCATTEGTLPFREVFRLSKKACGKTHSTSLHSTAWDRFLGTRRVRGQAARCKLIRGFDDGPRLTRWHRQSAPSQSRDAST